MMDFEIPDAKRVRREDLYDHSSVGSEDEQDVDEELGRALQEKLVELYGPSTLQTSSQTAPLPTSPPPALDCEGDDQQEFEFRLFSTAATSKTQNAEAPVAQKIVLELEEPDTGEGSFVRPHRDRRYYFAEKAEGENRYRFEVAAMTGQDVLEASGRRAWGLECPWRVRVIRVVGKSKTKETRPEGSKTIDANLIDPYKNTKPGKKRRIILRQKEKKRVEAEEKKKKETELKNESERDKKTRRNREKKLKRRQKEKAEKDAKRAEGGVANGYSAPTTASSGNSENLGDSTAGLIEEIEASD